MELTNKTVIRETDDMDTVRELFREYQAFLNVDLCFQDFDAELADLPGRYAAPGGALLLALVDDQVAGCVGMRAIDSQACEMKRLYIRSEFRGLGLGRALAMHVIDMATRAGYTSMRLDTLPHLRQAVGLYRSLGFQQIDAYCYNPLDGVTYWEKSLMDALAAK